MSSKLEARLFVDADLAAGQSLALGPEQTHYLKSVLRLKEGAVVALFNGRDGEYAARIESFARNLCSLRIEAQIRAQAAESDLWLVFAPIKRARIDFLIEKATELGAAALFPVMTRYTAVERVNLARLKAHAVEAAEQSERLTVPAIHPPQPLERLIAGWDGRRRLLLCDETGTSPPIAAALKDAHRGPWAVLIGPEGGFAETELDALKKLPFVCPVSLGPRVLRADTAALAGLAVLQALLGDAPPRG
ncbi:MAG TPA: 16S rRNA (uracil(1498)-N(3))-methyltransferase [Stellaceae bacterium]|nr:16S rRNA (uracil(1498)-N(3))-methyltransferase [Stellaceae bacterium]